MQERNTRSGNRERSAQSPRNGSASRNGTSRNNSYNARQNSGRSVRTNEGLSYKKNRAPGSAERSKARKASQQKTRKENINKAANYAAKTGKKVVKSSQKVNPAVLIAGAAAAIVLILVIIFASKGSGDSTPLTSSKDIESGVNYIKELEGKSVDAIESDIRQRKKAQRIEALKNGTTSVWSLFDDSVILGDSRAVGFYYYEFLPQERVLAEAGNTILNIDDHLEEIKKLNPTNVFICYGVNDIGGFYDDTETYCSDMKEQMQKIWQQAPNCTIYISSIIPCTDPAFDTSSAWRRIPEYNEALKKMCDENGWPFIDNDAVVEEYKDHYQPDGIHLEPVFYEPWALNMMSTVMDWEEQHAGGTSSSGTTSITSSESSVSSDASDSSESSDSSSSSSDNEDESDDDDDDE